MSSLSRKVCCVDGCERTVVAKGFCQLHYNRLRNNGTLEPKRLFDPVARFWKNTPKAGADECWLWQGLCNEDGYGRVFVEGAYMGAHCYSWRLHNGEIPKGLEVCHSCDTPNCVNPYHLWLGTHTENMKDMAAKGRHHSAPLRGEASPGAKLTAEQVRHIRNLVNEGFSQTEIAKRFGISFQNVHLIVKRKRWAHVD